MQADLDRYHRQMLLKDFGKAGQEQLAGSTALLLGCGALGSVAADLLSRAGVGHLVIVDRDIVEKTNLQRQLLFDESDVAAGMPKAEAAKQHIAKTNSQVRVTAIVDDINDTNMARYADGVDVIVDGLDNLETRYLANDCAVSSGLPYLYGAAVGTTGMAFTVLPHSGRETAWEAADARVGPTPCLRCLFEEPPPGTLPTCDTVGVLGPLIAIIASFQASEALKILTGNFEKLNRKLLHVDPWSNEVMQLDVSNVYEQADCPCCKHRRFEYLEGRAGSSATSLCGRDAVQLRHRVSTRPVDLDGVAARLANHGEVRVNDYLLSATIMDGEAGFEITLFQDGRAIIKGTQDPGVARAIYSRYVGT